MLNGHILEFDGCLGSSTAETPAKFWGDKHRHSHQSRTFKTCKNLENELKSPPILTLKRCRPTHFKSSVTSLHLITAPTRSALVTGHCNVKCKSPTSQIVEQLVKVAWVALSDASLCIPDRFVTSPVRGMRYTSLVENKRWIDSVVSKPALIIHIVFCLFKVVSQLPTQPFDV